jgi:hypothetical protein
MVPSAHKRKTAYSTSPPARRNIFLAAGSFQRRIARQREYAASRFFGEVRRLDATLPFLQNI